MSGAVKRHDAFAENVGETRLMTTGKLFYDLILVGVFGSVGQFLWSQSTLDWWGFGLFGLICAAAVVALAIRMVIALAKHIRFEWRLRRYGKGRAAPKSDGLASAQTLKDGGLIK